MGRLTEELATDLGISWYAFEQAWLYARGANSPYINIPVFARLSEQFTKDPDFDSFAVSTLEYDGREGYSLSERPGGGYEIQIPAWTGIPWLTMFDLYVRFTAEIEAERREGEKPQKWQQSPWPPRHGYRLAHHHGPEMAPNERNRPGIHARGDPGNQVPVSKIDGAPGRI